jgi:pimeloyl-ACP methyl ester carboxylesterase
MPNSRTLLKLVFLLALWSCSSDAQSPTQHWVGRQLAESSSQALVLNLTTSPDIKGTVDLPEFGASGVPASNLAVRSGNIHFELVGDNSTAVFDGAIRGDFIQGSWKEGAHTGRFELRLQPVVPSLIERSVVFANGGVRLSGSLLLPAGKGPFPALVLIQGAGPEPRSASRFMAEVFVQNGIAALIYDKRGVGGSSGDWQTSSFEDLAGDAVAGVNYLLTQPEIRRPHVGLMGSSQGGWIAPMAALLSTNVSFVIVKSAAGVTPEREELERTELLMHQRGFSAAETQDALGLYKQMIDYAFTGNGWEQLSAAQEKASHEKWGGYGIFPKDSWWFKFIKLNFRHDPIPVLQRLHCSVLVIFGGRDPNLPVDVSVLNVNKALASAPSGSLVVVFPKAGHDLRDVYTPGEPWSFGKFSSGYLDLVTSWVKAESPSSILPAPAVTH